MKKRNIVLFVTCLLILLGVTGCGNKTAISTSTFKSITEENNYITSDVTNQYISYEYVNEATVAQSSEGFQIEFYVLDSESNAISMFNTNKDIFESYKGNASTETSSNIGNNTSYTLTSNGYYMHLCRVDNTLLYVRVLDSYKDSVKDIIKKIGY